VDGIEFARLQTLDWKNTAAERIRDWRVKKREVVVHARGKVTHPDHHPLLSGQLRYSLR
jgi:hypothetical protein